MLTLMARCGGGIQSYAAHFRRGNVHLSFSKVVTNRGSKVPSHKILCRKLFQDSITNSTPTRHIHTSRPRYVNPILVAVLRPVSKFLAVLVGRSIRKWWQALPPKKKELFIQHLRRNRGLYIFGFIVGGSASYYYYETHVTTTLFTGRRRFMIFTSDQLEVLAQSQYETEMEEYGHLMLPNNHQYSEQVSRVGNRLLQANNSIPQLYTKTWTAAVIDLDIINCQVLPSGAIIMFKGMMDRLENDDQVAAVMAHEISHAILEHSGETLSHGYLLDLLILLPLAIIWAFLPNDGIAAVTHWFINKVVHIFMQLPHSRTLENEADTVGLHLAAKACFDVREASAFWGSMDIENDDDEPAAWLSTHPTHSDRQLLLDSQMDKALAFRELCKCPQLSSRDPRQSVKLLQVLKTKVTTDQLNNQQQHSQTISDNKESHK